MKILHAADLHLDSPLRGLDAYPGAPADRIRVATREALENLVAAALEEPVDLVLLAGDLYDGDWRDYATGLFFAAQMSRLRAGGIPVVVVHGNHDAASQITRSLRLPDNVTVLGSRAPETRVLETLGVAVHGQSYPVRAVKDDLARTYPQALPDLFNIGLLHTCAGGRAGHEDYAPCSLDTLIARGYDYWALGHVHAREELSRDPWVVFPGNLQGRHVRETGPKGATLVTVEDGRVARVEHRPLDVLRFAVCTVALDEAESGEDAVDLARKALEQALAEADSRLLAARVELVGATRAHSALHGQLERWTEEIRAAANDVPGEVWIEKVKVRTRARIDRELLAERDDPLGELVRSLTRLRDDPEALEALRSELGELVRKLPPELGRDEDGVAIDDPRAIREALADVEELLLPRLLGRADGDA